MTEQRTTAKRIISMLMICLILPIGSIQTGFVLTAAAATETQISITPQSLGTHHVPEESGIVASRAYPGIYWMISDSGGPVNLYATDSAGATKKVFSITGATNIDWEDIAIDADGSIWIADIGDNNQSRSRYVLYRVSEPNPYSNDVTSISATVYHFTYPNGPRDSEAFFVWQGIPYIVQKRSLTTEVYAFPALNPAQTVTLNYVGAFTAGTYITGADISADGHRLALINDIKDYHWIIERSATSISIADFFTSPTKQWRLHFPDQQGEAIGFLPGNYSFVVASEQGGFWKIGQNQYDSSSGTVVGLGLSSVESTPVTGTASSTSTTAAESTAAMVTTAATTIIANAMAIQRSKIVYAVDIVDGQLVDSAGNKFTMIGFNYGDIPENFKSGSYATDAQNIKNAGFNTVKLVKEWGALENSSSPSVFTYNNDEFTEMMNQIGNLTQQGVNVVVKIHADSDTHLNGQHLKQFLGSQYCATSPYSSDFTRIFYNTSYLTDDASGHSHLLKLWLKISQMTRNNSRVIGLDIMNEPTTCSRNVNVSIQKEWHQRINEIVQVLRSDGDNRIIFAEEAPFFEYYQNFIGWNDSKIVSSIHWYRAAYKTKAGSYQACLSDPQSLQHYWGNIEHSGTKCSDVALWVEQAQQKYPNQLFEVGEFGNIYENNPGDINQQWIRNSVDLFKAKNMVGWFYWSSEETGTWTSDLTK